MPDRFGDLDLQKFKVNVLPFQRQEFTDPQPCCSIEKRQSALSHRKSVQQCCNFVELKNIGSPFTLCTLTNELDWVAINPFITHRVGEQSTHDVSNLCFRSLGPLDTSQPILYGDGLNLVEPQIAPTRDDPVVEIAFVSGARRKSLTLGVAPSKLFQL